MTEVRIRHSLDAVSTHLTNVAFDQLDDVIPTINRWGLYTDDQSDSEIEISASFRYSESKREAYFEVVIDAAVSDD